MYNTEEFVRKARLVHGDKYDYSKVSYINSTTDVCIICPIHGEFWQRPAEHLRGKGCIKCGQALCGEKQKQKAKETFVESCKENKEKCRIRLKIAKIRHTLFGGRNIFMNDSYELSKFSFIWLG